MSTISVNIPKSSGYGAVELKDFINKSTLRGFGITMGILIASILIYKFAISSDGTKKFTFLAPPVNMELIDIPPESQEPDIPPPPPPPEIINTGPAARAGTPVPIPDAEIEPDMQEFADLDVMDRASAEGGDGLDLGGFSDNIDFKRVEIDAREEEPDPDDFVAYEQAPAVNIAKLQKLVKYPDIARQAGVEGRVTLNVLITKEGVVKKILVIVSDGVMLEKAAIEAMKRYGKVPPAIQNGQPVTVWLSVPIEFSLH